MKRKLRSGGPALLAVIATAAVVGGVGGGCGSKSERAASQVSPSSFRADPSKMTEEDKRNMAKLMQGSGRPPAGTPATPGVK